MLLRAKKIIEYFKKEDYAKAANDPVAYCYEKVGVNRVNRQYFLQFLVLQTNFLKKVENPKKRRNLINDTIDFCIHRGYITEVKMAPNATSSETHLVLQISGKQFAEPLFFLNTVLKEYGYINTILLSGIFWAAVALIGKIIISLINQFI